MDLNAARFLATNVVFLGIIVIGAVAFVFDLIMRRIERMLAVERQDTRSQPSKRRGAPEPFPRFHSLHEVQ